jgi:putative phage-type endonuclease
MSRAFEILAEEADNRPLWLKLRRDGIGASDISGIMGVSPWTTPFQVWASKVYDLPEEAPSEAMEWGRILESKILDEWLDRRERAAFWRGALIRNKERPYVMATPDAIISEAVVEVKNRSEWSWSEIPDYYNAQVQWQLIATGYDLGYLVVLHGGRRLETYEIHADAELQEKMLLAAAMFWDDVENEEAPEVVAEDNGYLASLWPTNTEETVEVAAGVASDLYLAREAFKTAETRKNAAEATVKGLLGEADTAVVDQQVIATWKTGKKARSFLVKGTKLND